MHPKITSPQNAKIKQLIALQQKSRERRKSGTFLIEGIREIALARQGNFLIKEIYCCDEIFVQDPGYPIHFDDTQVFAITPDIFNKVAYRNNSGGLLAVAKLPDRKLDQLPIPKNPFYLMIEQVEKPGNIGAVLRTADAAGADGLIICDPATDLFNPNIIRSSLGCLFTVPTAVCTNGDLLHFLTEHKVKSYATLPDADQEYSEVSYQSGIAILLGAESTGLSDFWKKNSDFKVKIPMAGKIDSLNISNAAAIVTFEAVRQRNSKVSQQ